MTYHRDPSQIDLDEVRGDIAGRTLSPKRRILGEALEERFGLLKAQGITTLAQLIEATKSKQAIAGTAGESGLPEEYLVILGREARGYLPKPIDLSRIPDVSPEVVEKLNSSGLKDSKKLWEWSRGHAPEPEIQPFVEMCDLARVPGVGPVFAKLLHLAGYRTTAELAQADLDELDRRLREANAGNRYTSVTASKTELEGCIRWARLLSEEERAKNTLPMGLGRVTDGH